MMHDACKRGPEGVGGLERVVYASHQSPLIWPLEAYNVHVLGHYGTYFLYKGALCISHLLHPLMTLSRYSCGTQNLVL